MRRVVLDTNIIVSALWSASSAPARIFELFLTGSIVLCYDVRIMAEYKGVLNRPQLAFSHAQIGRVLNRIRDNGIAVVAKPCKVSFADEDDKKFYEVARECGATLITGNLRHYPKESFIVSAVDFLAEHN